LVDRIAEEEIVEINDIISNRRLTNSIYESVSFALESELPVNLVKNSVLEVIGCSVEQASYDLDIHKRAPLFLRLIQYGPLNPDDPPELAVKENATTLSDTECGSVIQFIYFFMVNRFKGELGELLALKPVVELVQSLQHNKRLPKKLQLFWGDMIEVRSKQRKGSKKLGHYVKGADGLLVQKVNGSIVVHGVIEVKSKRAGKGALAQLNEHCSNLERGVKLGPSEYTSDSITISDSGLVRILVMSSLWKLNRNLVQNTESDQKTTIVYQEPFGTPIGTQLSESKRDLWKIALGWSREAIEQAAYEMTFWYMAQVGTRIYTENPKPEEWDDMTPEQAGLNAIKMMLYYLLLRPLPDKQIKWGAQIYNIYSFGYPLGLDWGRKRYMLWWKNGRLRPLYLKKRKKKRKVSE